ncbi:MULTISPECIES: enoyl-CoA hydratase/isomerase family protein [Acidianus]|uniref:Enoyl-CoA hydratase n=1 Tax=Candidatus Acidianus copahuensis TaxID=1160895 RepID=A0A031LKI2_9CREN|nr:MULTISPECIES: enoyl-CoA hydratase/isomerase family protein [Acidianus]EZQ02000.1 enoyl-CoA hydratase [Candidatus Acidianus copahuensis]NON63567.1 enoyl-CoA hydratase/isomerase family protein [Acidianus sp. RZ1]
MVIKYEIQGDVAWITLDREEKLNSFDEKHWYDLGNYIRKSNGEALALVLTGKGRSFSAGDDIFAMLSIENEEKSRNFFSSLSYAINSILSLEIPFISVVNGIAYGGGCEILLLSDIVIASTNSRFSIPEGRLGLIPPMALAFGENLIGRSIRRLAITGEEIGSEEARLLGIVDYVVPEDKLYEKVDHVLSMIKKMSPNSIRVMKKWFRLNSSNLEKTIYDLTRMVLDDDAIKRMKDFTLRKKR